MATGPPAAVQSQFGGPPEVPSPGPCWYPLPGWPCWHRCLVSEAWFLEPGVRWTQQKRKLDRAVWSPGDTGQARWSPVGKEGKRPDTAAWTQPTAGARLVKIR